MEIALINRHNFTRESLDAFSRYQVVKNVYRVKEGEMYLAYRPFVEIIIDFSLLNQLIELYYLFTYYVNR